MCPSVYQSTLFVKTAKYIRRKYFFLRFTVYFVQLSVLARIAFNNCSLNFCLFIPHVCLSPSICLSVSSSVSLSLTPQCSVNTMVVHILQFPLYQYPYSSHIFIHHLYREHRKTYHTDYFAVIISHPLEYSL